MADRKRAHSISRASDARSWHFLAPAVLVMGVVIAVPGVFSLVTSLHDYHLADDGIGDFIGLGNYIDLLGDDRVWNAALNTIVLAVIATAVPLVCGMVNALALSNPRLRARNIFLGVLLLPLFIPYVATGLMWLLILHPQQGILNYLLSSVGLPAEPWLGQTSTALITIGLIDAWQHTSLMTLLIYAGIGSLSTEPVEAARIDGASAWQIFVHISLPMLRPVIATAIALRFVQSFLTYDLVYVLTQGGPASSTETLSYLVGTFAFRHLEIGTASALSWLLVGCVLAFAVAAVRMGGDPTASRSGATRKGLVKG